MKLQIQKAARRRFKLKFVTKRYKPWGCVCVNSVNNLDKGCIPVPAVNLCYVQLSEFNIPNDPALLFI